MAALGEIKFSHAQNGILPTSPVHSATEQTHACFLLSQLKTMYDAGQLTDVIVHVELGKSFSCHRNVLAAISPYFRSMFTSGLTESSQKEVRLVGIEAESMQLVLNYAYTSHTRLTEANVQALFTAASIFQISSLQDMCANYMISRLDPQNCIGVFIFADYFNHAMLKSKSEDYIRKKILYVTDEQEFLRLKKDQLIKILSSDDLDVDREEQVYEGVMTWYNHDPSSRQEHLPEIFAKCIRLPLMGEAFFEQIPPVLAQAVSKDYIEEGKAGANNCIQRLGMTANDMIICFEAANKHSGKKQTVPCLDIYSTKVYKICKPPSDMREVGILVTPDNDIYIAGGYRPSNNDASFDHKAESDFWLYDHAFNKWIQKASMRRSRIGCILVYCCGKPFAVGGRVYEGDGRNPVRTIECYDSRDDCWMAVTQMPIVMDSHSAVVYKEKIYILQGDDFISYDPQNDYWCPLFPMTVPRFQGMAAVHKDTIYYVGGVHCSNRMLTVEAYNIEQNRWTQKKVLPFEQSTSPYVKLLNINNKLHLFVRLTQVSVDEFVFRTIRKNSLYQYDDVDDSWRKVYDTPEKMWDLGRHFECVVAKMYPQRLQKVL
uniref:Kelch repeat and BTB domain containing 8 n=1 Tax=Leptobrachium leishanense TaxID=445787 RepID=A0A8C5R6X6_9ANUR